MSGTAGELTALAVNDLADPLDETAAAKLGQLLTSYVAARRWYRAKTKTIDKIDVEDLVPLPGTRCWFLIIQIVHAGGGSERYILPLSVSVNGEQEEAIASLVSQDGERGVLYSALGNPLFRSQLLNTILCEDSLRGRSGALIAARTSALFDKCEESAPPEVESFVSRAEQSNTSIIYRGRYILKLFRKLEAGINPDLEIGKFLTQRGFRNTPAVLGSLEYRTTQQDGIYAAAILQQFVPNQGDAWSYTLSALGDFFAKALRSNANPPHLPSEHPLELIGKDIPPQLRSFIGPYVESAALLGKRTAEMHAALADPNGGADFAPEPFTPQEAHRLYRDLSGQADITFELLRRKQAVLTGAVADHARELLRFEQRVTERFAAVEQHPISALRIRHHGDYHLGQVLYTGHDFMIIDFEGEPARPLSERRAKVLALRDVAGMIRSFQYAAFAALFGQVPGIPAESEALKAVEGWAAAWNAYVAATYLGAYLEQAANLPFLPSNRREQRLVLDAFLLQKALYEVAYELNNRPDWLQIPLRGILGLVS